MKLGKKLNAVIIGGASGLGLATAKSLLLKGLNVIIADIN
jgi:NAD(P)-dependent dehydrogenase (short-subunit alcohol dehydrogenase family)